MPSKDDSHFRRVLRPLPKSEACLILLEAELDCKPSPTVPRILWYATTKYTLDVVKFRYHHPTMENTSGKLVAALKEAQAGCGQVVKDSKNAAMGYKYASAESIIEVANEALNNNGLVFYPYAWSTVYGSPVKEGDLATGRQTVKYKLEHSSGETREFETDFAVCPGRGRAEDKSEAAALTMNLGYTLRGLLLIAREDEPEAVDKRDDTKALKKSAAPVATSDAEATWIAKIKAAPDAPSLSAVGKELTAAKVAGVPAVREAYMDAAKTHGLVK